jgi:hypothetical protein
VLDRHRACNAAPALALYALAAARSVTLGAIAWVWLVPIAIVHDAVPALALNALAAARSVMLGAIAWAWRVPIAIVRDAVPALASCMPLLLLEA